MPGPCKYNYNNYAIIIIRFLSQYYMSGPYLYLHRPIIFGSDIELHVCSSVV